MTAPTGRVTQRLPIQTALTIAVFLLLVLALLLGLNMRRGLNHDEHQFVGSGVLMARYGLYPYAGFAYFHVPAQTYLYALIFGVADRFLLAARLVSVAAGWLTLAVIFSIAVKYAPSVRPWARAGYGAAAAVLLLATPLFVHTSGRAWNHDLPVLLTLIAFVCQLRALENGERASPRRVPLSFWIVVAGILVGLAAATRLSYAFLAPAFLLAIWVHPAWTVREKVLGTGWLAVGGIVGMAPVWAALLFAPQQFWFGNVVYNLQLNPDYYASLADSQRAMTLAGKLAYAGQLLVDRPGNLVVPFLFVASLVAALPRILARAAFPLVFVLLLLPFALLSALSPTPSQIQYYYLLYPLLLLAALYAAALWPARRGWFSSILVVAALVTAMGSALQYVEGAEILLQPGRWYPNKVHDRGRLIGTLAGHGRVLTLAPIHPMEGNVLTYPQFVTGPLGWRVAPLLAPEERARFGLVGPGEFDALLAGDPPRGVLAGFEEDDRELEEVLVDYATVNGYVPVELPDEGVLWLSPLAEWGSVLRLGAQILPDAPLRPGSTVVVTFYEQKIAPITDNLNVLVRVVAADGSELVRSEGWPYGAPTSTWPVGEVRPDGHTLEMPADAASGYYRVDLSFYAPDTLESVGGAVPVGFLYVSDTATEGPGSPAVATFEGDIRLESVHMESAVWQAGSEGSVELTWRAGSPIMRDYTVFLHLTGPDGQLAAQRDRPPLNGFYPTSRWQPGLPVRDRVELALPPELAPGTYRLVAGLYDAATAERLPVQVAGAPAGDSVEIGVIQVE